MITQATFITALTLNLWALPDLGFRVLSPLREERVAAVCERLRHAKWDVVLLQEAWLPEDRRALTDCGYPHVADEDDPSRPLDSGLLVLSHYPLERVTRLVYPEQPSVDTALDDGEALARKSALMARVLDPAGAYWVANTHLVSDYSNGHPDRDRYLELRREQLETLARWVTHMAGDEPVILGGDLNFGPESPLWKTLQEQFSGFHEAPNADKACTLCPPNTMHATNEGKVDHLFVSPQWNAVEGSTAMTEPVKIEDFQMSVSDHLGWQTRFERK